MLTLETLEMVLKFVQELLKCALESVDVSS